jgi:hypothetical protein
MARSSKISFVNVGNTSQELLPGAPNRVSLLLMGGNAGRVTVSNDDPAVLDNGLTFVQQSGPIEIKLEVHGLVVTSRMMAIASVGNTVIGVIETLEG